MYLFNPENDLALANFTPNYTPPASAIRMAEELAIFPIWYAGKGKKVIAAGEWNQSYLEIVRKVLPVEASLISFSEIALYPGLNIIPWGWNPTLRKKLVSAGVNEQLLPSPDDLARLRNYSNRRHAVEILQELQAEENRLLVENCLSEEVDLCRESCFCRAPHFCGESHFFTDAEELFTWLRSLPGNKVLKMPLSGSGKGLIWILGEIADKQRDWCRRVIREQGGVVAEPVLTKVQDFAMEFYLQKGEIRFTGYSLFSAAASGAYMGNELLSNARIEKKLSKYAPVQLFQRLKKSLMQKLSHHFPLYTGYAGVDMMVCETSGGYAVQPCVEINMRMNMGMVARIFYDRYLHPGAEGRFIVDYFKKTGNALSFHEKMQRESPLKVENGKILSGYLSLTPVTDTTNYVAYVKVL